MMQRQKNRQKQGQKSDLIELIDDSYRLDMSIKENKKVLDKNKGKLKQLATIEGKGSFSGELADAVFSNDTTTEIDPKALYDLLVEMEQEDAFFDLVSVKLGDARAKVGDMMLEQIWKQTVKKNAKIKFKKRG
jgi:hypothetical protein